VIAAAVAAYNFASMTGAEALDALSDLDAARWGEQEREASRRLHARTSRGLLINSIVHHVLHEYGDAFDACAKRIASAQLTAADRADLRKGG
jgi:hypothetical protein